MARTLRKVAPLDELLLDAERSGFDTVEVSEALGLPEATVEAAIHRARSAEFARRKRFGRKAAAA